jgi:poly-gamma-glutamate capsule biosynthesis protein CapA/YwtB (metallophosphatase superfamily)
MHLIIAGDLFIADNIIKHPLIDRKVEELFEFSDYRIVNLESPLTPNEPNNEILKTGPHLRSSAETMLPYLKKLKVDMVTLANNHILDYGAKGLNDTFNSLQANQISYIGAGNNLMEASKPLSIKKNSMKIAILNFAEREWSIAEKDKPGANPLDIIDNVNQIKTAKTANDKVVCIIHGGHEYFHLPSPRMVKQYRFYAENGADVIVGHHSHCIGGFELYKNVPIIYSVGNFLFTLPSAHEEWYTGLLAQLKIEKEKSVSVELHPVRQSKEGFKTVLLQDEEKSKVFQQQKKINEIILNKDTLQQSWDKFLQNNSRIYLNSFSPTNAICNRYLKAAFYHLRIGNLFINKQYLKLILNLIRCESHADVLESTIKRKLMRG